QKAAKKAIEDAQKAGDLDKDGKVPGETGDNPKDSDKDGEEGRGPGKPADQGEKKDETRQGRSGNAKDRQENPEGSDPGEGGDNPRTNPGNGGGHGLDKKNQKAQRARASQLQLERFQKKVDEKVLEKAQMSREQFQKFLRDYADLARRQQSEKDEGPLAKSSDGQSHASGGTEMKPTGKGKDDVRNEGRPKPPPGYRDQTNEVIRRLNEQK